MAITSQISTCSIIHRCEVGLTCLHNDLQNNCVYAGCLFTYRVDELVSPLYVFRTASRETVVAGVEPVLPGLPSTPTLSSCIRLNAFRRKKNVICWLGFGFLLRLFVVVKIIVQRVCLAAGGVGLENWFCVSYEIGHQAEPPYKPVVVPLLLLPLHTEPLSTCNCINKGERDRLRSGCLLQL